MHIFPGLSKGEDRTCELDLFRGEILSVVSKANGSEKSFPKHVKIAKVIVPGESTLYDLSSFYFFFPTCRVRRLEGVIFQKQSNMMALLI